MTALPSPLPRPTPPPVLRAAVIIDYQNVHLTARDIFTPGRPPHESLIDPVKFAHAAVSRRNTIQRAGYPTAAVKRVLMFRGLPHVDYATEQNRRNLLQTTNWRTDGAIVELRDLKYSFQLTAEGVPATDINGLKIPRDSGREKGIDVLCAIACLRQAEATDVDLVILASRDSDLVPVLDDIHDASRRSTDVAPIETASWFDAAARKAGRFAGGSLTPTGTRRIWNTNLGRTEYTASLDTHDYS